MLSYSLGERNILNPAHDVFMLSMINKSGRNVNDPVSFYELFTVQKVAKTLGNTFKFGR